jgi:hypothetical protein
LNADAAGLGDGLAALELLAHLIQLIQFFGSLLERFNPGREFFIGDFQVVLRFSAAR